jgi:signal transduction histidine kinase
MPDPGSSWQQRTLRVLVVTEWAALALGIVASILVSGGAFSAALAGGVAGMWVVVATAVPLAAYRRPFVAEITALVGVVTTITAATLTGAADSPYLLLAITPSLHTTVVAGGRTGVITGVLSGAMLMVVSSAQGDSLSASAGPAAAIAVISLLMAQVARMLREFEERAADLATASDASSVRLAELEQTHELLTRLVGTTRTVDFNIPRIARTVLESLESRFPGMHGIATVHTTKGRVVVATIGEPTPDRPSKQVPLEVGDQTVGSITIETELLMPPDGALRGMLGPAALTFANALRLQDLAGTAVGEERTRLARELHDEIGPSLASLGLSLDVAIIEAAQNPALASHLRQIRETVGRLVDNVRSAVADLREPETISLVRRLEQLRVDLAEHPPLVVAVDERRPARPGLAPQLHAIVTESVRNGARHGGATQVTVSGWIDYDRGRVVVEDDGRGFDPGSLPDGHYGVIGMRERAARSGIQLELDSNDHGTTVVIGWGES